MGLTQTKTEETGPGHKEVSINDPGTNTQRTLRQDQDKQVGVYFDDVVI